MKHNKQVVHRTMTCMRIHMRSRTTTTSPPPATKPSPLRPLLPSRGGSTSVSTVIWQLLMSAFVSPKKRFLYKHHQFSRIHFHTQFLFLQYFLLNSDHSLPDTFALVHSALSHHWDKATILTGLHNGDSCKCWRPVSTSPFQTTAGADPAGRPGSPSARAKAPDSCPQNPPFKGAMK